MKFEEAANHLGQSVPQIRMKLNGNRNEVVSTNPEDDGIRAGRRFFKLEVTEADELDIDITLADGSLGNLKIRCATLAQIILDRNAKALVPDLPESSTTEIQVGDGDINTNVAVPLKLVSADDLIGASQRHTQRSNIRQSPY